jgi:hypothetical protein
MIFTAIPITHNGHKRIAVQFENNAELCARFKKIDGALWSHQLSVWHLPDNRQNRIRFKIDKPQIAPLTASNKEALDQFIQTIQLKGYSPNTLKTY